MPKVKKETKVNKEKKETKKKSSTANRGMKWESMIEKRLEKLKKQGDIIGDKIPTDFCIVRKFGKITSAFPRKKSTVDFVISFKGRFLAIEAKSTDKKTSFPMDNIKEHQVKYLDLLYDNNSLTYYAIYFKKLDRAFLVHSKLINLKIQEEIKSLKLEWFENNGHEFDSKEMNFDEYIYLEDIKK